MPWNEVSTVSLRLEFVTLAAAEGANVRDLCRRYGVSPQTAYKWIDRHRGGGAAALADRPRRPASSPDRTPGPVEAAVLRLRDEHPAWGGRKLRARLIALPNPRVAGYRLPKGLFADGIARQVRPPMQRNQFGHHPEPIPLNIDLVEDLNSRLPHDEAQRGQSLEAE